MWRAFNFARLRGPRHSQSRPGRHIRVGQAGKIISVQQKSLRISGKTSRCGGTVTARRRDAARGQHVPGSSQAAGGPRAEDAAGTRPAGCPPRDGRRVFCCSCRATPDEFSTEELHSDCQAKTGITKTI